MYISGKDQYFVAVKVFLRDGDKLLIIKDQYKDGWDLPGGRLKPDEFETPLEDVVTRKMREEIGGEVRYTLGDVKVYFRHERTEEGDADKPRVRIFALGYEAEYLGGDIALGDIMEQYEWVDVHTFEPTAYLNGGWLKGMKEYLLQINRQK